MDQLPATHITTVGTVFVPVADQEQALAFYVGVLGFEKVSDFTYETGERWLEVAPARAHARLTLIAERPERPAGVETGIVLMSDDVAGDLATLHAGGAEADSALLPEGEVVWWSGAPLAGFPAQFRLSDPDGNSFLVVQAPDAGRPADPGVRSPGGDA